MVAFELDADRTHPLDFLLLQNGPINLVLPQRLHILADQLAALGYKVIHLPAANWSDDADLFQSIATHLHFPDYFGHNYPALDECLSDFAHGDFGWTPTADRGVIVAVHDFEQFSYLANYAAGRLLSYAVDSARYGALFGHRLLWLVEATTNFHPQPVGARTPLWFEVNN
ncbi:MAG: barstar family protein [Janthinobacterium lividum]